MAQQAFPAYIYGLAERDHILVFKVFTFFDINSSDCKRYKIEHGQARKDFLLNKFSFYTVKIAQRKGMFQMSERGFNAPYADILEMPTF